MLLFFFFFFSSFSFLLFLFFIPFFCGPISVSGRSSPRNHFPSDRLGTRRWRCRTFPLPAAGSGGRHLEHHRPRNQSSPATAAPPGPQGRWRNLSACSRELKPGGLEVAESCGAAPRRGAGAERLLPGAMGSFLLFVLLGRAALCTYCEVTRLWASYFRLSKDLLPVEDRHDP